MQTGDELRTRAGWRKKLDEWLRTNPRGLPNPRVIPDDLRRLREEFVRRFPREKLRDLTLEDYALGLESKDGFCYWLEQKLSDLGRVGAGPVWKYGVWWSRSDSAWRWPERYSGPEDALASITEGLSALVEAVEEGRFDDLDRLDLTYFGPKLYPLRSKPLSLYFPEQFLPIMQPKHLARFLEVFGAEPQGEILTRNRQLLQLMRGLPEFKDFDTFGMMLFLYDGYPQKRAADEGVDVEPPVQIQVPAAVPHKLSELSDVTARTRNVLLYGPPGTGKTYLVRRFTEHFLRPQLAASSSWAQRRISLLQGLKWYEAAAVAMGLAGAREQFKVSDLKENQLIKDYAELKSSQKVSNTLWAQMQIHTAPDSITVNSASRSEPFLFDKNDNSEWFLTKQGKEYVEANFGDVLAQLRNPQTVNLKVEDFSEFITFHQSFAYEEFVEGLKPVPDEVTGGVSYEVVPGVFRRICFRAEAAWRAHGPGAPKYLLVIDEINRANIAKVLGELITLIEDDKRLGEANEVTLTLPYSGERFGVPPNLYILGTMNTADRSIALLDLALRRRFTFVEMTPDPGAIEPAAAAGVDLRALLSRLNERVAALLDRDHRIGHSYLMNVRDADSLRFAWYARVLPLLEEYFYNDGERLRALLGGRFVRPTVVSAATLKALEKFTESEEGAYEVARLEGEEFLAALRELAGGAGADAVAERESSTHD